MSNVSIVCFAEYIVSSTARTNLAPKQFLTALNKKSTSFKTHLDFFSKLSAAKTQSRWLHRATNKEDQTAKRFLQKLTRTEK